MRGRSGEPWPAFGGASAAIRKATWLLAALSLRWDYQLRLRPVETSRGRRPDIIAGDCAGANCAIDPPGDDANAGQNLPFPRPAQCEGGNWAADQPDAVIIPQTPQENCGESECRVPRPTEAPTRPPMIIAC